MGVSGAVLGLLHVGLTLLGRSQFVMILVPVVSIGFVALVVLLVLLVATGQYGMSSRREIWAFLLAPLPAAALYVLWIQALCRPPEAPPWYPECLQVVPDGPVGVLVSILFLSPLIPTLPAGGILGWFTRAGEERVLLYIFLVCPLSNLLLAALLVPGLLFLSAATFILQPISCLIGGMIGLTASRSIRELVY
ncbi:MAG: hypothetical protein ACE5IB_01280 [Candidatus Geothermarchaeales archaeon]